MNRPPTLRSSLGVGVGLRRPHVAGIVATRPRMDWFEFTPENFINRGGLHRRGLLQTAEHYPMVAHGVGASLGSAKPMDRTYLRQLRDIIRDTGALWASDHLCWTTAPGQSLNELLPLPFTDDAVRAAVRNIRQLQDAIDVPWLIENISYYALVDSRAPDEAAFLSAVLNEADCGFLLDINNVYVNARNHGYDADTFIDRLPLDRVVQLHMAGHDATGPVVIDTHGAPVCDPVWKLFERTLPKLPPCAVLIEWDNNIPPWERLAEEAAHARALIARVRTPEPRAATKAAAAQARSSARS